MKIVGICKKCNGQGTLPSFAFLKKTCPHCRGKGKITSSVSDREQTNPLDPQF